MIKTMRRVKWWIFIIFLSLRWIPRINLGDIVIYNGKRYITNQGVRDPMWSLIPLPPDPSGNNSIEVNRSQFKKDITASNLLGSFLSGYRFYMGSWFDIWVNEGIQPWMRGCDIWATR